MEGARRSFAGAAIILAAALAAAGCCAKGGTLGDRDTPERAFAFVREAFAGDRVLDQYASLHPDFVKEQGLNEEAWVLARSLSPGMFRRAADLLGKATLDGAPEYLVATVEGVEVHAARIRMTTPGGSGVFVLVDWPQWELTTDDPDLPLLHGPMAPEKAVRIEGDRLRLAAEIPLLFPPAPGARILRFAIHHDWLLRHIESLQGFEEFLGEVRAVGTKDKETPR